MTRVLAIFPAASRQARAEAVGAGRAPRDFFYGALAPHADGVELILADSRKEPTGTRARAELAYERARNSLTNLGIARSRVAALAEELSGADLALSFTDAFSLSLGAHGRTLTRSAILAGGFHGLADLVDEVRAPFRAWARKRVAAALKGLDHWFFFGEADRRRSIDLYGLAPTQTHLFAFGVDLDFWSPGPHGPGKRDFVLAVGSDAKRDYPTLVAAGVAAPIRIVTRLPVRLPASAANVELIRGSYEAMRVDDIMIRDLYRAAAMVVVPVRDVYQPSGYSVTLQAMACGTPVILSRIRGLWDPDVFESGANCILVPPGDRHALRRAIEDLLNDPAARRRIGRAGRATAERHFGLGRMEASLRTLVASIAPAAPARRESVVS